jgi:hypothetical protein
LETVSVQSKIYTTPSWILAGMNLSPTLNFFKKYEYIFFKNQFKEWKNLSLIFAKFLKIQSKKSANLDCAAILQDFQKRSSTKC